jgi:predicted signal transduction protein with EAL and GGDEF domain
VLKEVARRLSGMDGEGVFVGRVGGDEFGFFGTCDPEKYQRVKAAFERLIELPVETKQGRFRPNYSAGIAHSNGAVTCATELFERADFALSTARENRKETSVSYDACLDARRSRDTEILSALLDEETRDWRFSRSSISHAIQSSASSALPVGIIPSSAISHRSTSSRSPNGPV